MMNNIANILGGIVMVEMIAVPIILIIWLVLRLSQTHGEARKR